MCVFSRSWQKPQKRLKMAGGWKAELGRRPPASPSCRLYLRAGSRMAHNGLPSLRAVGSTSRKPACKPTAYKPRGWKRPRREGGIRKEGTLDIGRLGKREMGRAPPCMAESVKSDRKKNFVVLYRLFLDFGNGF